ncbi:MAG: VWA domain-containing protein [Bacteroidetes bacterium]|nr:VWA domain-containing protein [Bacteroidota bacterium]
MPWYRCAIMLHYLQHIGKCALLCLLLCPAVSHAQSFYFTGGFKDSTGTLIPFVNIKLRSNQLLYQAGSGGEFGISAFVATDTATCYAEGFDTTQIVLMHGKYQQVVLRYNATMLQKAKLESRLSSLSMAPQQKQHAPEIATGNGESYNEIVPNHFTNTNAFPSVGFVPNNNHASYSNIRRFITHSTQVPPNAVRIEELWNYFNLQLPQAQPGDSSMGMASALSVCPWNASHLLLMLNVVAPKIPVENLPPANMVFLIDNSGSMEENNRLPLLKNGFKKLVEHLRPQDRVAIVTYGGSPGIMLPPVSGKYKDSIRAAIDALIAGGATAGSNGIQLAYELATTNALDSGVNKVILATDGDFNMGITEDEALERLIKAYRHTGVTLSCLGVGMGNYKDSKIEVLAKMGNGNFAYLDTEEEAQKVMVQELTENLYHVAADASIHVYFDSSVVQQYKLVGYDNRRQALANNTLLLNGANIGSGQTIVAMLEIVPKGNASIQTPLQGSWELQYKCLLRDSVQIAHNIPFTAAPMALPLADATFKKATTLAWYGQLLRQATPQQPVSFTDVMTLAAQCFAAENKSDAGFLQLLQKTQQVYNPAPIQQRWRKKRKTK